MPQPCRGSSASVFRMSMSRVPCTRVAEVTVIVGPLVFSSGGSREVYDASLDCQEKRMFCSAMLLVWCLVGSGREPAGDVVCDIGVKEIVELVRNGAGSGRDFLAVDFADADEIAIRRRNKNFVRGIKIFGAKSLLDNGDARFGSDFEEDAARDAFEAA